jgi:DNA polymerase III subunit epsilon
MEKPLSFAAIDFETANYDPGSACAVGVVRVEDGMIVARRSWLIRPPSSYFVFTHIHGLTWADVRDQPEFGGVWPDLRAMLEGVKFLAAHNASFDRSVLESCCRNSGVTCVETPFECSMRMARRVLRIRPTGLSNVCQRLNIPLVHHECLSDAEGCARIVLHCHGLTAD